LGDFWGFLAGAFGFAAGLGLAAALGLGAWGFFAAFGSLVVVTAAALRITAGMRESALERSTPLTFVASKPMGLAAKRSALTPCSISRTSSTARC